MMNDELFKYNDECWMMNSDQYSSITISYQL